MEQRKAKLPNLPFYNTTIKYPEPVPPLWGFRWKKKKKEYPSQCCSNAYKHCSHTASSEFSCLQTWRTLFFTACSSSELAFSILGLSSAKELDWISVDLRYQFFQLPPMASRAVLCTELDDFKTWKVVTKEKPTAPAGKVVVKMTLVPVNPADTMAPPTFLAHFGVNRIVIGSEGLGYVEEVGANVTKVKKGQRVVPSFLKVFFEGGNGSWQDYVVASEEDLFVLPDSIPDEVAAQFIGNPWTVWALLEEQHLSKGDYLLQGAAGSVLGRLVIQLAKHRGIKTINVVRRDDVKDELKKLGADEVINSLTEDVVARVKEITGGKLADGALDPIAGKATQVMASAVKSGGKVFVYGALGSKDHTSTIGIFDLGRVNIQFWSLLPFVAGTAPAVVAAEVTKLLEEKVLEPLSGKKFKLEEFKEAIVETEKPGRGGKVLLTL